MNSALLDNMNDQAASYSRQKRPLFSSPIFGKRRKFPKLGTAVRPMLLKVRKKKGGRKFTFSGLSQKSTTNPSALSYATSFSSVFMTFIKPQNIPSSYNYCHSPLQNSPSVRPSISSFTRMSTITQLLKSTDEKKLNAQKRHQSAQPRSTTPKPPKAVLQTTRREKAFSTFEKPIHAPSYFKKASLPSTNPKDFSLKNLKTAHASPSKLTDGEIHKLAQHLSSLIEQKMSSLPNVEKGLMEIKHHLRNNNTPKSNYPSIQNQKLSKDYYCDF